MMVFLHLEVKGVLSFFFFNDTATTVIYTLSLHDALPILIFVPLCGKMQKQNPVMYTRTRKLMRFASVFLFVALAGSASAQNGWVPFKLSTGGADQIGRAHV